MKNEVHLLSIIYSKDGYSERIKMLLELGKHVKEHIIITSSPLDGNEWAVIRHPNQSSLKARQFWIWAYKEVKNIVSNTEQKWIVHEYLSGITNLLLKIRFGKRIFTITSTYSIEVKFLFKRGWLSDSYSNEFISLKQQFFWFKKSIPIAFFRFLTWLGSDIILGNSSAVTNDLKNIFPKKRTAITKTSLDKNLFKATQNSQQLKSDDIQIIYAGRINPPKGIGLMFKILQELYDEKYKFKFTIIGSTWNFEQEWFKKLTEFYKVSRFTNIRKAVPQEELYLLLQTSNLLILPSFYEGSPRIIKEALACGTLVLCSDIPGSRAIDEGGNALIYFDLESSNDFKDKLKYIINNITNTELNNRRKIGQKIMGSFDYKLVCKEMADLYEELYKSKYK